MFTILDWIVLVLYMALSAAIGLWVSRGGRDFKEYMLGGGSMPWVAIGISLIATSVSATTFLGAPADVFDVDMTLIMTNIGSFLSILVVGWVFIPRLRESGITSAYELFEKRFSRGVRRLAAFFYSLHLLLRTGILLYAPSLVLSRIIGVDLWVAILLSAVVATAYTWYGGIKAVVWTDVMQFVVFFGGGLFALWVLAQGIGGWHSLYQLAAEHGKTRWFDATFDPANARTLFSAGLAYAVLEIAIRGCDQQFVQRYLSCADTRSANRSSILSMVLGLVVSVLFYWLGAALFVYYKVVPGHALPDGMGVNDVFPHFIVNGLPSGVTGLVVAAIYAAAMSSLSSAINALSNTTEKDLLCTPPGSESLLRAKLWTLLWAALGTAGAFFAATQHGSLLKNALFFTGLFTGPLLGMFLLAFFAPRTRPFAVMGGVICGMLSLFLFNKIPILPSWTPPMAGTLSWPWNPLVSLSATIWLALAIDLVAPRQHADLRA